jgi:hypothetical protein
VWFDPHEVKQALVVCGPQPPQGGAPEGGDAIGALLNAIFSLGDAS